MKSTRARLDNFVRRHKGWSLRQVRECLAQGDIWVDGQVATSMNQVVSQFTHVQVRGVTLAQSKPIYILLNKPKGIVSATKDNQHITVLDIINFWHIKQWLFVPAVSPPLLLRPLNYSLTQFTQNKELHIAGRLDFNSTGIVLLTNDGRWSRNLSLPGKKVAKKYKVALEHPVGRDDTKKYIEAFEQGVYFPFEGLTTLPAKLSFYDCHTAEVILVEGRYHQIKRMFGFFQNKVLELHRFAVGNTVLDGDLSPGRWRYLSNEEAENI